MSSQTPIWTLLSLLFTWYDLGVLVTQVAMASLVVLCAAGVERSKAREEEVEPGEGDHVHPQLPQVSIQLAREPQVSRGFIYH